jgi:putative transposase
MRQPGCRLRETWVEGQRCENSIWQRSFHDRIIRSDQQLFNTIQYINCNAVKHQLVDDPIKWPYSSFHNYNDKEKALIEIDYLEA